MTTHTVVIFNVDW